MLSASADLCTAMHVTANMDATRAPIFDRECRGCTYRKERGRGQRRRCAKQQKLIWRIHGNDLKQNVPWHRIHRLAFLLPGPK